MTLPCNFCEYLNLEQDQYFTTAQCLYSENCPHKWKLNSKRRPTK